MSSLFDSPFHSDDEDTQPLPPPKPRKRPATNLDVIPTPAPKKVKINLTKPTYDPFSEQDEIVPIVCDTTPLIGLTQYKIRQIRALRRSRPEPDIFLHFATETSKVEQLWITQATIGIGPLHWVDGTELSASDAPIAFLRHTSLQLYKHETWCLRNYYESTKFECSCFVPTVRMQLPRRWRSTHNIGMGNKQESSIYCRLLSILKSRPTKTTTVISISAD